MNLKTQKPPFPALYFSDSIKHKNNNELMKNELKLSACNIGDLEKYFFSKENIKLINKQLILTVYKKTNNNFLISEQKEDDLVIVMRYIFIEYSRNLLYNISGQIKELNCRVISDILPHIITNVEQHIGYLKDISTQPIGPPLPINTKNVNKTLPMLNTFF